MDILIVEDSDVAPVLKRYVQAAFNDFSHVDVRVARCISEAAPLMAIDRPQVILLDLSLPLEIGDSSVPAEQFMEEFVPQFASMGDVVVCTAHSDQRWIKQAIEAGANDFISKNVLFDPDKKPSFIQEMLRDRLSAAYWRSLRPKRRH